MSRITVCYKCAERTIDCHAKCDKYLKESAERNVFLEEQYRKREEKNNLYNPKQRKRQRPVNARRDNYRI